MEILKDIYNDLSRFFERLAGWFAFVFGATDDPYGFDGMFGSDRG